jgi:hypothetical protein
MPCLVSLTGKDADFQSLSWATWATESQMENEERISGVAAFVLSQLGQTEHDAI